jgi:hypothetical protein
LGFRARYGGNPDANCQYGDEELHGASRFCVAVLYKSRRSDFIPRSRHQDDLRRSCDFCGWQRYGAEPKARLDFSNGLPRMSR